jgi:hypothetical protein
MDKKRIDPESMRRPVDLQPYDYAMAFQTTGGEIVYWEDMPYGEPMNPELMVTRQAPNKLPYTYHVYGVVVTDSPLQPHTVSKGP